VIFFVPFFITGFHTFDNYTRFLRFSASLDLKDAPHMFSWNGFFSKLDDSERYTLEPYVDAPDPLLIYGLIALTAVPMLIVWRSRDFYLGAAATIVAMLLVSTHSVWYDWALLAVAGLFLVLRPMSGLARVQLWVLLLVLYLTANQSTAEVLFPDRHFIDWHRSAFYTVTPAAFGALLWMAALAISGGLVRPPAWLSAKLRLPRRAGS
jgi:hypothetical protein